MMKKNCLFTTSNTRSFGKESSQVVKDIDCSRKNKNKNNNECKSMKKISFDFTATFPIPGVKEINDNKNRLVLAQFFRGKAALYARVVETHLWNSLQFGLWETKIGAR